MRYISCHKCNDNGQKTNACTCGEPTPEMHGATTEYFDIPWQLRQDPIAAGSEVIAKQKAEIAKLKGLLRQVNRQSMGYFGDAKELKQKIIAAIKEEDDG